MAREPQKKAKTTQVNAASNAGQSSQKQNGRPIMQELDVNDLPPPEPPVNNRNRPHDMTVAARIANIKFPELAFDIQAYYITCLHCFVDIKTDNRAKDGHYFSNWKKHAEGCREKLLTGIKEQHCCNEGAAELIYEEWLIVETALWPGPLNEVLRTKGKPIKSPRKSRYRKPGAALVGKPCTKPPRTKAPTVVGASTNSPRDYNTLSSVTSPPSSRSASCSDLGAFAGSRPGRKELHLNPLIPSESPSPSANCVPSPTMSYHSEGSPLHRPPLFAETEAIQRARSAPAGQKLWPSLSAARCAYDTDSWAHSVSTGWSDIGRGWSPSVLVTAPAFSRHISDGTRGKSYLVGQVRW